MSEINVTHSRQWSHQTSAATMPIQRIPPGWQNDDRQVRAIDDDDDVMITTPTDNVVAFYLRPCTIGRHLWSATGGAHS